MFRVLTSTHLRSCHFFAPSSRSFTVFPSIGFFQVPRAGRPSSPRGFGAQVPLLWVIAGPSRRKQLRVEIANHQLLEDSTLRKWDDDFHDETACWRRRFLIGLFSCWPGAWKDSLLLEGSLSPEIHKARVVQQVTCFENLRQFCLKMFGLKSTGLPALTYCHIVSTLSIEFSRFSWLIIVRHLHIQLRNFPSIHPGVGLGLRSKPSPWGSSDAWSKSWRLGLGWTVRKVICGINLGEASESIQ